MKKSILHKALPFVLAALCAFGLTACGLFGGDKHEHLYGTAYEYDDTHHWHVCEGEGDCDAPESEKAEHIDENRDGRCDECRYSPMTVPQDAPVEIYYTVSDTEIKVYRAYYGTDKRTSDETEYKLDDGEWKKIPASYTYLNFSELEPASTHTIYARMGAWVDNNQIPYAASEPFSVSATTDKAETDFPTKDKISYAVAGKTVVFTLGDGIELSLDDAETFSAERVITHTYPQRGTKRVYIRYAETATHKASGNIRIDIITTDFAGGDGTASSPYLIGNFAQLKALDDDNLGLDKYFALTADVTCDNEILDGDYQFRTHIDGRGHKISGLKLKAPLFNRVTEVKDLTIENAVYVSTLGTGNNDYMGNPAILAANLTYAENVSVSGSITVNATADVTQLSTCIGGICARLDQYTAGTEYGLKRCRADITVSLPDLSQTSVKLDLSLGGLAGLVLPANKTAHNQLATISRCSANLVVTGADVATAHVGGLVGGLNYESSSASSRRFGPTANISDCYTTGSVQMSFIAQNTPASSITLYLGTSYIGGIAPEITGSIERCYSAIDFDINTELYAGYTADILLGGICAQAHKESGFSVEQKLQYNLFAGSISVTNAATENIGGSYKLYAVCAKDDDFTAKEGMFYKPDVANTEADEISVNAGAAAAIAESSYTDTTWQLNNWHLSDAYWNKTAGQLPTLK